MGSRREFSSLCTYYPLPCDDTGINHICLSLHAAMQADWLRMEVIAPMVRSRGNRAFIRPTVPRTIHWLPYRKLRWIIDASTQQRFVRRAKSFDVAYLWSEVPLWVFRSLREMGKLVVREKFNCHRGYAKRILDGEYDALGWATAGRITAESVEREREELELVDFVFAPSPQVRISLLDQGVRGEKIIDASFGWDPRRFDVPAEARGGSREFTVVFVGLGVVRKGIHLLLDMWSRAGSRGRLLLAGQISPDVQAHCAPHLARGDVEVLGHVADMGAVYRRADVFVFPSLEEGGPLVTYEAMAHGLPVIVSPMGAGAVARHGVDGYVIDPHDSSAWIAALRSLEAEPEARRALGRAAAERAREFTWDLVGARRREALRQRFPERSERNA